ncbi:molybdate ABC transporter substrate-binding protein [Glaciecola siphonariae]|uniref:Molybdate ABC transporter substrate-binding protein n=1 Tax=Glaciecola siphonariae TaxID=521012 RepID=A0ABV9LXD3_9ALTE
MILLTLIMAYCSTIAYAQAQGISAKPQGNRATLTVAVASNFYYPLSQIIAESDEWRTGNIRLVSGSSGVLFAQIVNGAPYDLFLSADAKRPLALIEKGLGEQALTYTRGSLVIWPSENDLPARAHFTPEPPKRIAIANPQTAPFGKAAEHYLKSLPNYSQIATQLVYGNNIAQTFQFVDTGNAQIAFVAQSMLVQAQAKFPDKHDLYTRFTALPRGSYPAILQKGVVLLEPDAEGFASATALLNYLRSDAVQKKLLALGYLEIGATDG